MARYLKASLNLENEINAQGAMHCVTGNEGLFAAQAKRQVKKILGCSSSPYLISEDQIVTHNLQKFVESDALLRQAKVEIFGEDTD